MGRAINNSTSLLSLPSRQRWVVLLLGFLLLLLAHGTALIFRIQPAVSPWFPPSGVAIALTLCLGPIGAVLTWAASFIAAPAWGNTDWARFASITDAIEPLVAWFLFYRCFRGTISLKHLRDGIAFLLSAPLAACGTSAVLGTLALVAFGKMDLASLPEIVPHWWTGNAIGTMVVAPVALLLASRLNRRREEPDSQLKQQFSSGLQVLQHQWLETGLLIGSTILFALLTVEATQVSVFATLQLSLLSIIPIFWAVSRFGIAGSMITASFSVIVTLLAYLWVYPNAIALPAFPVSAELLYTHKLSLLMQTVIALLAGTAITERATTQVELEVEKIRHAETETRAQLSEALLLLNRSLNEANQQLQESERRFRTLCQFAPVGIYLTDGNGHCTYVNEKWSELTHLSMAQAEEQGWATALYPEDREPLFAAWQAFVTGRAAFNQEYRFLRSDGSIAWVHGEATALIDEAGAVFGFIGTVQDITDRRLTEIELRRHKQELKTLIENSPDIIARVDRSLRHLYVSPAIETITGIPAEQFVGKTNRELGFPEEICQEWEAHLQAVFTTGQPRTAEFTFPTSDGSLQDYESRLIPELAAEGSVKSVLGITRNVTELKQVERSLRLANEQFRLASKAVNSAIYDWDIRQNRVERTSGMDRVFGYTPEEMESTGEWYLELIHPDDIGWVRERVQAIFATGEQYYMEYRVRHGRGDYIHVADQGLVIRDAGQAVRVVGSATDISERARLEAERKQVEAALQESEKRYRDLAEAMPQMVWMADAAGAVTYWNQRWYAYTGIGEAASLGLSGIDAVHPDDRDRTLHQWQQATCAGETLEIEYRIRRYDGVYRWFITRAIPLRDSTGQIANWIGTITDIDDQKRIQEDLRQSEERLSLALSAAQAGMWQWFKADNRTLWSDENFRLLGYEPGSIPSTYENWQNAVHPDDRDIAQQAVSRAIEEQSPLYFEYRVCLSDGSERWLADRGQLTYDAEGKPDGMIGIQIDITQRKQAEIALHQSQERLTLAMEAAGMGSWDWNIQTGEVYWSTNLERLFGMAPGGFDGRYETVMAMIHPDDRQAVQQAIHRAVYEHQEYNIEFRFIKPDGTIRWAVGCGQVFYSATDTPIQMAGVDLDISERKQVELERARLLEREQAARQQAESASRMKDEFLAIVSHELRSPLNGILGWSRLLRTRTLDPNTIEKALASIERNAQAQTQLIEDLLDISRIIRGTVRLSLQPVNLIAIIHASLDTVRPTAETKSIRLSSDLAPTVGLVSGDPDRLQQIIWNLLSNAVKFTPVGGQVEIRLRQVEERGRSEAVKRWNREEVKQLSNEAFDPSSSTPSPLHPFTPYPSTHPPTYAQIIVTDTGKGISAEFLPHVFDRFRQADSTTTRTQGGLGLGLAIVRSLVELHGGTIWAESAGEGQGATFVVELPLLPCENQRRDDGQMDTRFALAPGLSQSAQAAILERVRVLIVDDEADTREFLATALEQFGATVTIATSAWEAFALFQQNPPDLLLSDIGMPEEDGYTLIQRIRALPPERGGQVPAAALTAYVRGDDRMEALRSGFQMHVPKPIEPLQLLQVVSQLVSSKVD